MKLRLLAAATLLVPYAAYAAQEISFIDLLTGNKIPSKLKLADIPADYKAVKIKIAGGQGSIFDMLGGTMGAMMGALGGAMGGGTTPDQVEGMQLLAMVDMSWTNGTVARVGGQDYLVTYKAELNMQDLNAKTPPKLSEVKLTLVRTDAIQTLTPEPDVTKEAFIKVLTTPIAGTGGSTGGGAEADPMVAETLANAKQLAMGMIMYTSDYDDLMPYVQDTNAAYVVTQPYIKNKQIVKTKNPKGGMMRLNMAVSGIALADLENPAQTPMYFDSEPWPDGRRVVAFCDASARVLTQEEWSYLDSYLTMKLVRRAKKPLPATLGKQWEAGG